MSAFSRFSRDFFRALAHDLHTILTSFSILTIVLGGNVIYAFFYPSPYLNDIALKQKIALVDEDKTALSRDFAFFATTKLQIAADTNLDSAMDLLRKNEVFGILFIPRNFEKNAVSAALPEVSYIANNAYFFIHSTIIEGLNAASGALKPRIKLHQARFSGETFGGAFGESSGANLAKIGGESSGESGESAQIAPIKWQSIPLFNPSVGYLNYIIALILTFVLHQSMLMSCGILCGLQNQLVAQGKRGYFCEVSPIALIAGRILAFCLIYAPIFLFYFGFVYDFYGVATSGQILEILAFGGAFLAATAAFGAFLGSLFNRMEYLPQIVLIASMPLLFSLGFVWAAELIPAPISAFLALIPIKPALEGFISLNQMGGDFSVVRGHFWHLLALLALYFCLAVAVVWWRFWRQKRR